MRIPTATDNQVQLNALPAVRRERLVDTTGESIGNALGDVGSVVSKIQIEEKRKADASAVFDADMGLSQFHDTTLQQAKTVKGKDAIGLADRGLSGFDKLSAEQENGISSNRAKTIFKQQSLQRRQQLSGQLNEVEGSEREKYYQTQQLAYRDQEQNSAALAYGDPKAIAESLNRQDASSDIQYSSQPDEVKAGARRDNRAKTYSKVFDQIIADEDWKRAKSYLATVENDIGDAETVSRIKSSIHALQKRKESEERTSRTEQRSNLNDQVNDAFAARQFGIPAVLPGRNAFIAAYGDEGADRYRGVALQWQAYEAAGNAANMAPAQAMDYLSSLKPAVQEGAADSKAGYDLAIKLYAQQRKRLADDPVSVLVASRPELAKLQAGSANDEEATGDYFKKLLATQQTLGIENPRLLSDGQRSAVAKRLDFDPENPKSRAAAISGLKANYGKYFTDVMREVAPKLEGQARVMLDMNLDQATRLDAAMSQKKELDSLVKGDAASDINKQLDIELEDVAVTLADNVDAESRLAEFRDAAELLAKADVLRGTKPQEAARKAAAAVVNDQYNFVGTMRIPRTYDADIIERGAALAQKNISMDGKFRIPSGGGPLDDVYSEYPRLQNYGFQFKDSQQKSGDIRKLEFYQPGERDSTFSDNSRPGIERFDQSMGKSDVFGEMLHYLPRVDKTVGKARQDFQSSITSKQADEWLSGDYGREVSQGVYGNNPPKYDEWLKNQGGDAFFRGYLTGQFPKEAYTAEQKKLFESVDAYLREGASPQKDMAALVASRGYWVTNESGTGLVLRIPARTGHGNVYKEDGSRVELTWEQLLDMKSDTPDQIPYRYAIEALPVIP